MLINMPKVRLNDVPDWVLETLGERAAVINVSLSDYILRVLERAAAGPPPEDESQPIEEVMAAIASDEPVDITDDEILLFIRLGRCEECLQRYLRGES